MARVDDYRQARDLSVKELSGRDPLTIARLSGARTHGDDHGVTALGLRFLNRDLSISWPDMEFSYEGSDKEVPIQEQVLILHYLEGACSSEGVASTGEWVSFQDIPDGRFYMDAFIRRAKDPLLKAFGKVPKRMIEVASRAYDTSELDYGDFSIIVNALPLVPVALVLWEGDEEFPPEGNILFDKSISKILSAEDTAWLAGMIVYPLMGMTQQIVN